METQKGESDVTASSKGELVAEKAGLGVPKDVVDFLTVF